MSIPTATYAIDPSHSEVTFSVRHMMISKVRGTFGVKSATLVAPENPLDAEQTGLPSGGIGRTKGDHPCRTTCRRPMSSGARS